MSGVRARGRASFQDRPSGDYPQPGAIFRGAAELVYHEDEPMAHPSSVALNFVSRLAGEHVKVVLTGEGSDELLAGYNKYRATIFNLAVGQAYQRALPAPVRRVVQQQSGASEPARGLGASWLAPSSACCRKLKTSTSITSPSYRGRGGSVCSRGEARERMQNSDPYVAVRAHLDATDAETCSTGCWRADMKTYLHELLMKQDQMSMAASLKAVCRSWITNWSNSRHGCPCGW